ncbi:MAG: EAL domain-containing protein [Solirubrobacterales bacterium]
MGESPTLAIVHSSTRDPNVEIGPSSGGWRLATSELKMGIAIITRSSQILEVNASLASMLEVDADRLTSRLRQADSDNDTMLVRLQRDFSAVATAGPGQYEISIHRSTGETFPAEVRVMALVNDDPTKPEALLCSITDRSIEEAEVERLTRNELRATQALSSFPESIAILDADGEILANNQAWDRFALENGGTISSVGPGINYLEVCGRAGAKCEDARIAGRGIRDVIRGELDEFSFEYECHSSSERRWFELSVSHFRELGEIRVVVCHENITHRRVATDKLAMQAQLLAEVDAAVIACDLRGKIIYWSRGATELLGREPDAALGRELSEMLDGFPETECEPDSAWEPQSREAQIPLVRGDGVEFTAQLSENPFEDHRGAIAGTITIVTDVSERAAREQQLASSYDYMLTVSQSIGDGLFTLDPEGCVINMNPSAERLLGWSEAELMGKPIFDAIGYELTLSDRNGTWATRVEDDHFQARDGRQIPVAHTTSPFETAGGLSGAVVTFTDITTQKLEHKRLELEIEDAIWTERINRAFELDQFDLFVQPIFDVATGQHTQNELLIRMHGKDGLVVSPKDFLPAAERQGLIQDIDRWVIRRAANLAGEGHPVEFNLSAGSLCDPELADFIIDEMDAANADPTKVVVEITETAIVENDESAEDILRKLRANGFRIALDDFGTGYGSFTYLKNLPVDYLKIDIEFIRDLPTNESSKSVVEACVRLAKSFGLTTVAEGVEESETVALLGQMGVDQMQGFALGEPEPFFIEQQGDETD